MTNESLVPCITCSDFALCCVPVVTHCTNKLSPSALSIYVWNTWEVFLGDPRPQHII